MLKWLKQLRINYPSSRFCVLCLKMFDTICIQLNLTNLPEQNVKFLTFFDQTFQYLRYPRFLQIWSKLMQNLYVNDILHHISDTGIGCRIRRYKSIILCSADDIMLLSSNANAIKVLHRKVSSGLSELSLKIDPHKSAYIVFKRRSNVVAPEKIRVNGYCQKKSQGNKIFEIYPHEHC